MTAVVQSVITIVIFFGMLGGLVVIHELGHFVTARLARVRVLEFGIGFPPRAKVLRSEGETLYTLNWLPIGGFVRLEGEDGDSDDPRSFVRAALPTKVVILVAGVAMNLVLAFVIFFGISALANPAWGLTISEVKIGSPAATAGLVVGDQVMTLDGEVFDGFKDPGLALRDRAGQTVQLGVVHADGASRTITATLRRPEDITVTSGALGIAFGRTINYVQNPVGPAFGMAAERTGEALTLIWDGLAKLADSIVNRPTQAPPVTGPIGIASQVGDVFWQLGPVFTLYLAGILSANLALVNILPFPPLDGGRIVVLVLKSLVGERISLRAERLTYFVGFVFLMVFLAWISFFDITAPGRGQ
ncbi:MAG: M50 family metallopeptidase [Candidatus Limnocylindrales bacterium]